MLYTVNEIAKLTGVTVKTLHYYHKIGLLQPCEISDAGYRLYGINELERLQQILFYRELDFSLKDIKTALEDEASRIECLINQQKLLFARKQRMESLLSTIRKSISLTKKGEIMDKSEMFRGFNKEEWREALSQQNKYIKDKYGYDLIENEDIDVKEMNKNANEAQKFMNCLSEALRKGWKVSDERVQKALKQHIEFLNEHITNMNAKSFFNQAKFFLEDDFHRNMLENQQVGLSYYLYIAAEVYAGVK